jgi:hypothetical protein
MSCSSGTFIEGYAIEGATMVAGSHPLRHIPLLFAALSITAPTAGPAASATGTSQICVHSTKAEGAQAPVRLGGRSHRESNVSSAEADAVRAPEHTQPRAGAITVQVDVNVIRPSAVTSEEKLRFRGMVAAQMAVLNRAYAGQDSAAAASTPFRFKLTAGSPRFFANPIWYNAFPGSAEELDMKRALHRGDATRLNVYTTFAADGSFGWTYFPNLYETNPTRDGVVLYEETLPGGNLTGRNEGRTLDHEVGHWLGLFHTFQDGCSRKNDRVADTPAEAFATEGCPVVKDTCSARGADPVHNYMDYSDDDCMNRFTPGQSRRMTNSWYRWRG